MVSKNPPRGGFFETPAGRQATVDAIKNKKLASKKLFSH